MPYTPDSYYREGSWVTVGLAQILIADLYTHDPGGGFLHVVLDDYNTEDQYIHWCLTEAHRHPCDQHLPWCHKEQELIGMLLLAIPESSREAVIREAVGE